MRPLPLIALALLVPTVAAGIQFPDPDLESVLRRKLEIGSRELTPEDLATLVEFRAIEESISDLTGLEHAINLEIANLECNRIVDVSPLAGMTKLRELDLGDNRVVDISPLAAATALEYLHLGGNEIVDISALANLSSLTHINIGFNDIVDVSPLAGFASLEQLSLSSNPITDFTPISGIDISALDLRQLHLEDIDFLSSISTLQFLTLTNNRIADISPLYGLGSLISLQLRDNRVANLSTLSNLSNLESVSLDSNRITNISALGDHPTLQHVTLSGNRVTAVDSLATIPGIKSLSLSENLIQSIEPLADIETLDWIHLDKNLLDLSPGAAAPATIAALEEHGTVVYVDPQIVVEPVSIPDPNLERVIRDQLDHSGPLTTLELAHMRVLNAETEGIADLTGLEHAIFLEELHLGDNAISDIAPIRLLRRLRVLELFENQMSSMEQFSRLNSLEYLDVSENAITDTEYYLQSFWRLEHLEIDDNPLTNLRVTAARRLAYLDASETLISDLTDLVRATRLEELHISHNPNLSDLGPIAGLPNLRVLRANGIPLGAPGALAPIGGLPALETLWLSDCDLTDLSDLIDLPSLDSLNLSSNAITDLSPLAALTSVTDMELDRNHISDFSALTNLAALEYLNLDRNYISRLPDLSGLTSLGNLSVDYNSITDIAPLLTASETVAWFGLSGNFIDLDSPKTIAVQEEIDQRATLLLRDQRVPPPTPVLAIDLAPNSPATLTVSFVGEAGMRYLLLFSQDLITSKGIAAPVVGDGSVIEFTLPMPATERGFFMVVSALAL